MAAFAGQVPHAWRLQIPGVLTRLPAGSAGIALTFDCCGGPGCNAVDQALIDTLQETGTPTTFFLNLRWVQANPGPAKSLAENPLFDIGNHGTRHVPLSVSGRSAYGIPGTASAAGVYDEIMVNQDALYARTGGTARYFWPGTAYLDDIAVAIARCRHCTPQGSPPSDSPIPDLTAGDTAGAAGPSASGSHALRWICQTWQGSALRVLTPLTVDADAETGTGT